MWVDVMADRGGVLDRKYIDTEGQNLTPATITVYAQTPTNSVITTKSAGSIRFCNKAITAIYHGRASPIAKLLSHRGSLATHRLAALLSLLCPGFRMALNGATTGP